MRDFNMQAYGGDGAAWNALMARLPGAHFLQTWEWAQTKARHGWDPIPVVWMHASGTSAAPAAAAMMLRRSGSANPVAARFSVLYVPKGPVLAWGDPALRGEVLDDLQALAKRQRAIFVKCDPEVVIGLGWPSPASSGESLEGSTVKSELRSRGWRPSESQIQFKNTMVLDITRSESELLDAMKPKTRYNVRLASRKGVRVRPGTAADLELLYRMYAETSQRDGFVIRNKEYYTQLWETFLGGAVAPDQPGAAALLADVDGETVAGLILFFYARTAYYIHGMSRAIHRDRMPNHLLQWEAIRHAKARGCERYDMWGAPDIPRESDRMWGVYRFKEGLGAHVVRTLGAWDYPVNRIGYAAYTKAMPWALSLMRRRGRAQTRNDLQMA